MGLNDDNATLNAARLTFAVWELHYYRARIGPMHTRVELEATIKAVIVPTPYSQPTYRNRRLEKRKMILPDLYV